MTSNICTKFQVLKPFQSKVIEPGGKHPPPEYTIYLKKPEFNRVKISDENIKISHS